MNASKSNQASAFGIREAVIGFSDDGCVLYYFPEDVHIDEDGRPELDEYHYIGRPSRPGDPEPILALKEAGTGLWIGEPREWVSEYEEQEVEATGRIAFTEEAARFLEVAAEPGDLIIHFKKREPRG